MGLKWCTVAIFAYNEPDNFIIIQNFNIHTDAPQSTFMAFSNSQNLHEMITRARF